MHPEDFRALPVVRHRFDLFAARRAIYFDYEGLPYRSPVLLGWRIEGRYRAATIDERFASCVGYQGSRNVSFLDHRESILGLLERAEDEDRRLVSWSLHDVRIALPHFAPKVATAFRRRYVDAKQVAKSWHRNKLGRVPPDKARLAYFGQLLGVLPPKEYGAHTLAPNLQAVEASLAEVENYALLPSASKKAWRLVIKHNRADLRETADVLALLLAASGA